MLYVVVMELFFSFVFYLFIARTQTYIRILYVDFKKVLFIWV